MYILGSVLACVLICKVWYALQDLSDVQWRGFRSSLPALSLVFLAFGGVSRVLRHAFGMGYRHRMMYILAFSVLFLAYLHGVCALHVLLLVTANWALSQVLIGKSRRISMACVWISNLVLLVVIRITDGFLFTSPGFFAEYRGVFRWEICYNLTMLRMISYSMDMLWRETEEEAGARHTGASSCEDARRIRREKALPSKDLYGYLPCMAHALYPPLYIAGPIICYNDFVWQVVGADQQKGASEHPWWARLSESASLERILVYLSRCLLDILCIEILTHFLYFNSIAVHRIGLKYKPYGLEYNALQVALTGWWTLTFMWLKFTVLWRFFRSAALVEGIDPPENMKKCFAMNYDVQGFWKNWHASFNQWLVRYMYIPFGGSRNQVYVIWPIFFFVALWHDIDWRLLGWASLMCLAFLPEIVIKHDFASHPRWEWLRRQPDVLRVVQGMVASINIAALMCGNMVGFVVGLDGLLPLIQELASSPLLVITSLTSFYCAARLMFSYQDYIYSTR